jgi:hypothetical protein
MAHREALALDPALEVEIHGLHPTFRVASNGRVRLDIIIQLVQERPTTKKQRAELGGMRLLMGSTVILNQQGEVRFVIAKPLVDSDAPRQRTVKRLQDHIRRLDDADDDAIWRDPSYFDRRMLERANFAIVDAARSKAALEAADDEDVDLVDEGEG